MAEISPRLAELLAYMDEMRRRLLETAQQVNPSFASIRPHSGAWSAAENLAHLAKVEDGVARLVQKSVEWARDHGVGPETSNESVLSSLDRFNMVEPDTKMTAPEMVTPDSTIPMEESLESLRKSRERLRAALTSGCDLDLASVKRPHRVLGEINIYQWGLFVAQHEERHRRQIDRTMGEVTERAAECAPIV
jgi:uncharacterized damage-inducible protein DinB